MINSEGQPTPKQKSQLHELYKEIVRLEKKQVSLSKDKINSAEELYNSIDQPTEMLDKEISARFPEGHSLPKRKKKRSKRNNHENRKVFAM